jgi:tRNA-splicing ligase RtcB
MRDYYVEQGEKLEGIDRRLFAKAPYLEARSRLADDYLADLRLVLDFAGESRKEMMIRVLEVLSAVFSHTQGMSWQELIGSAHDIAHNYVGEEEHFGERLFVHRKGAICLAKGQIGLIPGSMGTCSYVVEGRGNSFGFNSCSHGAGRVMSRAEAFRVISDKDFNQSMEDVVHAHDPGMKDEAPAAYKDIHRVMRAQKGLVKVLHELTPLLSVKGR